MVPSENTTNAEVKCKSCGEIKPLSEFHSRPETTFGYRRECKECRCIRQRLYSKTDSGKSVQKVADQKRNKKFPERRSARSKLFRAISLGLVYQTPCLVCGAESEAHHPDYSQPLDVVWLCQKHHKEAHLIARN